MPNNKVQLSDGTVLMDTSGVTVAPGVLLKGYTALDKTGTLITGTAESGGVVVVEEDDEHGGKVVHITGETVKMQSKTATPTKATQEITPDTGYSALSGVTVNPIPNEYIIPSGSLTITENGQQNVAQYASVNVNVQAQEHEPNLQEKSATPTETTQEITADSGYDGMSKVTVGAISSGYVGSGVTRRNSSDLSTNGATVNVPAGYYEEAASKSIASGSATTPATTITADPTISVSSSGLITATASASKSVTPTVSAGYVSSGTAGTVTVSGSKTQQLTTQAAKTVTPTKSEQTAVTSGVFTTGIVKVAAIPAAYITTTDANAAAGDIVSGQTAYVNGSKVTGTLEVRHIYVGTAAPGASLGENGDIYLQIGG